MAGRPATSLAEDSAIEAPLDDFERQWSDLVERAGQIEQKGFDRGRVLGATLHEVRGLACHLGDGGRLAVIAGDKHGFWYAGEFDLATGQELDLSWRQLPALPSPAPRVIDVVRVVPCDGGHAVVIGTRGDGAWIAPLAGVLAPGWQGEGLRRLPGGDGAEIRRLLYDRAAQQLWCAAGTGLLAWSLVGAEPRLTFEERLGCRVTALAIDEGEEGPADDHLYVATNRATLHLLRRAAGGAFQPRAGDLAPAASIWQGRVSVVEHLCPLSDVRAVDLQTGRCRRRFAVRGVIGATQRHLLLLQIDPAAPGRAASQVWLISEQSQVLDLAVFCLPDWQAIVASTLDGNLRIFRPSGVRKPPRDEFAATPGSVPEADLPSGLLSGFEDARFLGERVYGMVLPQPFPAAAAGCLPVVLGMGDHTVRMHRFTLVWELRRQAAERARDLAGAQGPEELLRRLEALVLAPRRRSDERALVEVLPALGAACASARDWWRFRLLVWDVLAQHRDPSVPVVLIQALRQLQRSLPDQLEELELLVSAIRKFVLDRHSFSEKRFDFLQLAGSSDPGLADDRTIYRSILCSRRHDPLFSKDFRPADLFGEVQAFMPLPGRGAGGAELAFDRLPPGEMRFLVGTYRRTVWLFDGTGRALRLTGNHADWGHLQGIHCRNADLVLAFSQDGLRRLSRERLAAPWSDLERAPEMRFEPLPATGAGELPALSFCPVPGADGADERFLWGDAAGRIHLTGPAGRSELTNLVTSISPPDRHLAPVTDLRSWTAAPPGGGPPLRLVAACTGLGSLHVLAYSEGTRPRLDQLEMVWAGTSAATAMLVAGGEPSQLVVASLDGMVAGYWLLLDGSQPGPPRARLALYWAYRASDAVRAVQHLAPATPAAPPHPGDSMIVIGSYDEHLHVLDLAGRHLEIVYLPQVKIDRFATARARPEDGSLVEARVYACGFENQFRGLRIVSRRRLLAAIDAELATMAAAEHEETLSRWRAFALGEGHLRHRFARQSSRYPGAGVLPVIAEIRRLLAQGDSSDGPTGMVTALLRRLFQNRVPGAEAGGRGAPPQGLREILADRELFVAVVQLLKDLEEQWDTPGSLASRRVQLFWIRSFLRNLESMEMVRRWLALGGALEGRTPLAAPERLLEHFLAHPHEIVQLKVLQYLERLFFGWRGVAGGGLLGDGARLPGDELDRFLAPLLLRLRAHPGAVSRDEPQPVVLQIGKTLAQLLRGGHLDPLALSHRLQALEIPAGMYEILIDQCEAMALLSPAPRPVAAATAEGRLRRAARLLRLERDLEQQLAGGEPAAVIVAHVEELLSPSTLDPDAAPEGEFVRQAQQYFRTLIPLLRVDDLDALHELKASWQPDLDAALPAFRSYQSLRGLPAVLGAADQYYNAKYQDLEFKINTLRFEDFDRLRRAWRELRSELRRGGGDFSRREQKLLDLLVRQWDRVLDEEQTQHLLGDIIQRVSKLLAELPETPLNIVEAASQVDQEKALASEFFTNLFTRLLLFAEPSAALFLHCPEGERSVRTIDYRCGVAPASLDLAAAGEPGGAAPPLAWVDPRWRDRDRFEELKTADILRWMQVIEPDLDWEIEEIPILAEKQRAFGFYCFGWSAAQRMTRERFRLHRLTWTVLLQALAFRSASAEQKAFRGRIFSIVAHNLGAPVFQIRSDLRVLLDGFLEDDPGGRQDKYHELLRQARQMNGIIDGILSLSDRATERQLTKLALVDLVYDVVRTMRRDAKARGIRIEFPKPDHGSQAASRQLTDETWVYDILLNVLGNAVKYSAPGSTVTVSLRPGHKGAEILVQDQGPGIPKDEVGHIFEPFFRGSLALGRKIPGLGIGLYVAKLYTEKLSGKIQAKNHSDGGATFTIFLPRLAAEGDGQ